MVETLISEDDATNDEALSGSGVLYGFCIGDGDLLCNPRLRQRSAGRFTLVEGVLGSWLSYNWSTQGS